jgi:hypothetical protein
VALIDQYNCAQDVVFRQRVEVSMLAAAIAIQSEATTVANHTNRSNYAKLVLNNPGQYSPLFAEAICANNAALTVQSLGTITDATINSGVSAVWNSLAGML